MRILQVITSSELGGAQSVVIQLANHLCCEHEVIVAAGEGDGKMWLLLDARVRQVHLSALKRELSPLYDSFALLALFRLYIRWKPDIIHLHSSKAGVLGRLAFPASKTVYTVHGFDSIRLAYRKYLRIEKALQTHCKAIVGVSDYDKNNLLQEGITHAVRRIYNGIATPISLEINPFPFAGKYVRRVLCIARVSPPKRLDLFMKTAALLPQYAFMWIGNKEEITPSAEVDNLFFLGNLPNAGAYTAYADLFMLPSDYEGLPMVLLEAMSFGKPIVASRVGGISEIVEQGKNGYTVQNNPEDFARQITYILENQTIYEQFSNYARRRFLSGLTATEMVASYLELYNE